MIYFLFPRRAIMALVKNKLSPVDQFLNTSISVVRTDFEIDHWYGYSVENGTGFNLPIWIREKGCFQGIETGSILKMSRNMGK